MLRFNEALELSGGGPIRFEAKQRGVLVKSQHRREVLPGELEHLQPQTARSHDGWLTQIRRQSSLQQDFSIPFRTSLVYADDSSVQQAIEFRSNFGTIHSPALVPVIIAPQPYCGIGAPSWIMPCRAPDLPVAAQVSENSTINAFDSANLTPSIWHSDPDDLSHSTSELHPGAEIAGEGSALLANVLEGPSYSPPLQFPNECQPPPNESDRCACLTHTGSTNLARQKSGHRGSCPRSTRHYQCSLCSYNSVYKKDMTRHEETHLQNRPVFRCHLTDCDKSYFRKDNLSRHQKSKHCDNPFRTA